MCQSHAPESSGTGKSSDRPQVKQTNPGDNVVGEEFPWHIGIYDAHCHPTDSMHAISHLPDMKARVLTIMATRSNDQELVTKVASDHHYTHRPDDAQPTQKGNKAKVLPSFGYHPWFSHLIHDDLNSEVSGKLDSQTHYTDVLTSTPINSDLVDRLPSPTPLSRILAETRANLIAHSTALVGEVGLDRTFRIPLGAPGPQHNHPLSKHRVKPAHQIGILQAQLRLAGELNRAASVHIVGGQGIAFEALRELWRGHEIEVPSAKERKMLWRKKGDPIVDEHAIDAEDIEVASIEAKETNSPAPVPAPALSKSNPFPPRICLHSFSGPPETVQQYLHPSIPVRFYFSFSEVINFSTPGHGQKDGEEEVLDSSSARALAAMKVVPEDRLLIESDLNVCGDVMDHLLEKVIRRICKARGWNLKDGVTRLKQNWTSFVFGET